MHSERSGLLGALLAMLLLSGPEVLAAGTLLGTVRDATTRQALPDVVVTATAPEHPGEAVTVTGPEGDYRLTGLPPGVYTLRFEKEDYKPYARFDVRLREARTRRIDVELTVAGEEVLDTPGCGVLIDYSGTSVGQTVDYDLPWHRGLRRPSGGDGAARTSDSLVEWVPGVTDGLSIHGSSPSENEHRVDGLSTGDAASGLDALPVSTELLSNVSVLTDAYLPEHGRATGGVVLAETKSGANEHHGSAFVHWAPGALEGRREPVLGRHSALGHQGDFGATLSGPLVRDRLWFFVGAVPSLSRVEDTGPRGQTSFTGQRSLQALGKLMYLFNPDHHLSLSVLTAPGTWRGTDASGASRALDRRGTQVSLHQFSAFLDKRLLVDVRAGGLSSRVSREDGAEAPAPLPDAPEELGALRERALERYQLDARALWFANGLGSHLFKVGVDMELATSTTAEEPRARAGVLGGFVQDSWSITPRVTVNGGLRFDVQSVEAGGRTSATQHLLSPRLGVVVVPGREFRTKLFAHYARHHGRVPLGLLDGGSAPEPRRAVVDPELEPTSVHELVAGAEYEVLTNTLVSARYLHRWLDSGLAALPEAGGDAVQVVNPGSGLAADLPEARRTYDAVTLVVHHSFSDGWLAHLSYTASRLRGNHPGPGAPVSVASSPLPEDRPHVLRAYGLRELRLTQKLSLTSGLSYQGASGTRRDGAAARSPWVHSLDAHLAASWRLGKDETLLLRLDAFNVLNLQEATRVEERATTEGTALVPVRYQPPRQVRLGTRYTW